ncbi:uncharacterized protein [Littorina saxatilis]
MDPGSVQEQVNTKTKDHSCTEGLSLKQENSKSAVSARSGVKNGPKTRSDKAGREADIADDQSLHERDETDDDTEVMQSNGDIFSPDSEVVTVICSSDVKKTEGDGSDRGADKDGCDGYDTHSDSIETLEEESPHDVSQEQLSESLLKQIRLTSKSTESGDVFDEQTKDSALLSDPSAEGETAEDSRSTDSHEVIAETTPTGLSSVSRPGSLSLPRPLQYYERNRSTSEPQGKKHAQAVRAEASGHQRTRSEAVDIYTMKVRGDLGYGDDIMSRSLPHGTILRKGEMIEFVADDLTEIIKRSSPMSKDSESMGSRRSSQRSIASTSSCATSTSVATSSGLSRSPSSLLTQSPDAAPPIDPEAVMELEMCARRVADNVDHMMGNLRNNLHKMSAITVGCLEAYKTSVDITCDSVDSSIKSMYALMAKCEELNTTMEPVKQIGAQIKEIKRLLDRFEEQLLDKP